MCVWSQVMPTPTWVAVKAKILEFREMFVMFDKAPAEESGTELVSIADFLKLLPEQASVPSQWPLTVALRA